MDVADGDGAMVVRLDPGDHVLTELKRLRDEHDLDGAFFSGIGAVDRVTLGHYDVSEQEYSEETFDGQFEVVAFNGNIGPDKVHAHIAVGRDDFSTLSGHCSGARVSGTFEVVVWRTGVKLSHRPDRDTGLDVFDI